MKPPESHEFRPIGYHRCSVESVDEIAEFQDPIDLTSFNQESVIENKDLEKNSTLGQPSSRPEEQQGVDEARVEYTHDWAKAHDDVVNARPNQQQHLFEHTRVEHALVDKNKYDQESGAPFIVPHSIGKESISEGNPAPLAVCAAQADERSQVPLVTSQGIADRFPQVVRGRRWPLPDVHSFPVSKSEMMVRSEIPHRRLKKLKKMSQPLPGPDTATATLSFDKDTTQIAQEMLESDGRLYRHGQHHSGEQPTDVIARTRQIKGLELINDRASPSTRAMTRSVEAYVSAQSAPPKSEIQQLSQQMHNVFARKQQEYDIWMADARKEWESERKSYVVTNQQLCDQQETLTREKEELSVTCTKQRDELLSLKARAKRLRMFVDGLGTDMQSLRKSANAVRADSQRVLEEGKNIQESHTSLTKRTIDHEEDATRSRNKALQVTRDVTSELFAAQSRLESLECQLSDRSIRVTEERHLRLEAEKRLCSAEELNDSLAKQLESNAAVMDKLLEIHTWMKNSECRSEVTETLQKAFAELQGLSSKQEHAIEAILSVQRILEKQVRQVETKLQEEEQSLVLMRADLAAKTKELEGKTKENTSLQNQISALQGYSVETSAAIAGARAEVARAAKDHLEEERSKWANEKSVLQSQLKKQAHVSQELHAQMQKHRKEEERYQAEYEKASSTNGELEGRLARALQELQELQQINKPPAFSTPGRHENARGLVVQEPQQTDTENRRPTPAPNSSSRLVRSSTPELGSCKGKSNSVSRASAPMKRKAGGPTRVSRKRAKQNEMSNAFDEVLSRP